MVFRDRSYSVLLVCGEGQFNAKVSDYLPCNEYYPVRKIHGINEARRELLDRSYDIVIVNWPRDAEGKKLAVETAEKGRSAVLLMADRKDYDEIYFDVVSFGVFCIPKHRRIARPTQSANAMKASHAPPTNAPISASSVR